MSTPRRLAPMSSGTPSTRMRRVGKDWVPLGGNEVMTRGISGLVAMQSALPNLSRCHDTVRTLRPARKRVISRSKPVISRARSAMTRVVPMARKV